MVSQQPSRKQLHQSQQSEEQAPSSKQPRFHDPEKRDIYEAYTSKIDALQDSLHKKLSKVEETAGKLSEILHGKYQVNEIDVIRVAIKESLEAIAGSVNTEVELAAKVREITKQRMEIATLKSSLHLEKELVANLRLDQNSKRGKLDELKEELQKTRKTLNEEQKKSSAGEKKVRMLELRLEILLESSEKIIPREDNLRTALSEIMKENEM